jgi:hypothetical protein
MRSFIMSFGSVVLLVAGCQGETDVAESSAAATGGTPASAIGYTYSSVAAPANGLTATNVQDGLNQCAAVGYTSLTSAKAYTDQKIAAETTAFQAADQATLGSAKAYTDQSVASEATARQTADSSEAAARQAADNAEAVARQGADAAETYARQAAIGIEASQRMLGDQSTLSSAIQYTDGHIASAASATLESANQYADGQAATALANAKQYTNQQVATVGTGAAGANFAPFGYGSTQVSCSCDHDVCTGFCNSYTGSNPDTTKRSAQIVNVTHVSFFDADRIIVELCNSQTSACYDFDVPANTPVNEELKHPLAVDSMSIASTGGHELTYGVFGYTGTSGGAKPADQAPFGTGSSAIDCACNNGDCHGFCDQSAPDGHLAKRAPQMLNVTSFSLSDPDGLQVDFCNSQSNACYTVLVPPGQIVHQELEHPIVADTMSVFCLLGSCNNGLVTYSVAGYY